MKRFLFLLILFCSPAWATLTKLQSAANNTCGTSVNTCAVTVSALTLNSAVVVIGHFQDTTTTISSVSGGGTYAHPSCHGTDSTPARGVDCQYMLVTTSSVTTVTATFSASISNAQVEVIEYSYDATKALMFDTSGTRDQTTAVTNPAGVTLTLSGTNDVVIQFISSGGTASAVSGSFTDPSDFNAMRGDAGFINSSSGTAPTWTTTSARAALGALALKEQSVPGENGNMDEVPYLLQSAVSAVKALAYSNPVKSGSLLVVAWNSFNATTAPTIADDLGSSWSLVVNGTTAQCGTQYVWAASAPYTGMDTVTLTTANTSFQEMHLAEFSNTTTTTDGSSDKTYTTGASFPQSTNSITTSTNGALLYSVIMTCNSGAPYSVLPSKIATMTGTADSGASSYRIAGTNGSYSATWNRSGASQGHMSIVAFKSSASLKVTTRALPDASTSGAYSAQLNAESGSGSYTWAITSGALPDGLSLSSGGAITGTPTRQGVTPITFQVTDGASNTATKSLSITVGTAFGTVTKVQNNRASGCNFSLGTVTAGNIITIGAESLSSGGHTLPQFFSSRVTWSTLPLEGVVRDNGTAIFAAWGIVNSTGLDTLQCVGASASSSPNYNATEWSNVQQIFETAASGLSIGTGGTAGATITSSSITTGVSETLYSLMGGFNATCTFTIQSPYTSIQTTTPGDGYQIGVSAGSPTVSFLVGGSCGDGHYAISLWGLRPSISGTAPAAGVDDEAQVY